MVLRSMVKMIEQQKEISFVLSNKRTLKEFVDLLEQIKEAHKTKQIEILKLNQLFNKGITEINLRLS